MILIEGVPPIFLIVITVIVIDSALLQNSLFLYRAAEAYFSKLNVEADGTVKKPSTLRSDGFISCRPEVIISCLSDPGRCRFRSSVTSTMSQAAHPLPRC